MATTRSVERNHSLHPSESPSNTIIKASMCPLQHALLRIWRALKISMDNLLQCAEPVIPPSGWMAHPGSGRGVMLEILICAVVYMMHMWSSTCKLLIADVLDKQIKIQWYISKNSKGNDGRRNPICNYTTIPSGGDQVPISINWQFKKLGLKKTALLPLTCMLWKNKLAKWRLIKWWNLLIVGDMGKFQH
jgi:hypothetical protein